MPGSPGSVTGDRASWSAHTSPQARPQDPEHGHEHGAAAGGAGETSPLLAGASPNYTRSDSAADAAATSPLSLVYVRAFRGLLLAVLALNLGWVGALVVDFYVYVGVSPAAGAGLEPLLIAVLALLSIAVTVSSYKLPNSTDRTLGYITALLLLVDVGLIAGVPVLWRRIGNAGLISYLGALGVFALGGIADSVVERGQAEARRSRAGVEGRHGEPLEVAPPRRSVVEYFEIFVANLFRIAILVAVLLLTLNLVVDSVDSLLEPTGRLVPIRDVWPGVEINVHVSCFPAGNPEGPIVVLEAGESSAEDMSIWALQAEAMSTLCYWDRPGRGFSDNAPSPLGIGTTVDLLQEALRAQVSNFQNQTFVLVGAGVGGLYSRVLAARLGDQVRGLVLIDALHEDLFYQRNGIFHSLLYFGRGLVTPLGVGKLQSLLSGYGSAVRVYGAYEDTQARWHKALAQQEVMANRRSRTDIREANLAFERDTPLLVVSSSESTKDRDWSTYQRLLLKLSDRAMAWKILDGPSEVWRSRKSAKELTRLLSAFIRYSGDANALAGAGLLAQTTPSARSVEPAQENHENHETHAPALPLYPLQQRRMRRGQQ